MSNMDEYLIWFEYLYNLRKNKDFHEMFTSPEDNFFTIGLDIRENSFGAFGNMPNF